MTKYLDEEGTKYLIEKLSGNSGGGIEYYEFDQATFKFSTYGLTASSAFIITTNYLSSSIGSDICCYIKLSSTNAVLAFDSRNKSIEFTSFSGIRLQTQPQKGGLIIFKR